MVEAKSNSEAESENLNELFADNPLTNPKQDRLGYAPFAKHLADSICKMNFPGGFVIGVYGYWGFGKSTLLNFLVHYLKEKPESEQPIIVPFNPWLFTGDEDITRRFVNQLQTSSSQLKSVPKGVRSRLSNFLRAVSEMPVPYAQAGKAVVNFFDDKQKDTSDLKEELEDTLEDQHPRIVVTIDDIDRLPPNDISQLFRLLKAIPNFTDVVYVLAFYKDVVDKALTETQGVAGDLFLDKIIQASFELPLPDKTLLRRLFFEKLNVIFSDTPKQLFAQNHWGNVYFQGIDHFINNPRDIVRLTNVLTVTYPVVRGEVNPVDLVAIESLRVFRPTIYDIIRKNPKFFTGYADSQGFLIPGVDELKQFHNSWLAKLEDEDKDPIKRLILRLFPKLEALERNTYYDVKHESTWRKHLRICSSEIFINYFRLTLTEGEFSDTEVKTILVLASDTKAFGEKLIELANQKRPDGTTQVRAFLEQLENYTEAEIPSNCIFSIVQAFLDVGDHLLRPEDEPYGMFDLGNDIRIGRIISQLLHRLDEQARFEMLKDAIANGNALSIIVHEVVALGQEQSKYGGDESIPEEEWLISGQHHTELEEIGLKRLRDAAQENSLLQVAKLPEKLYYWQTWAGKEEAKEWAEKIIENDERLIDFLEKFLQKDFDFSEDGSDETEKTGYRLDPKWLEPYVEPSLIIDRLGNLDETSELTQERKTAIAQFMQEYEMREQGKDPDDAKSWESES